MKSVVVLLIAGIMGLLLVLNAGAQVSETYIGIDDSQEFELFADQHSFGGHAAENDTHWKYRIIMGQQIIGNAQSSEFDVDFGYIYMLNFRPTFDGVIPAINAKNEPTVTVKHPYTNNSLLCEVNFTEYDVGDIISVSYTWYRNATNWYNNSEIVLYNETEQFVEKYGVAFEHWPHDDEVINVSSSSQTFFSVNTTDVGNIEPEDTNHYELWICSVRIFDQIMYSWNWINSSPMIVYNHPPDYNVDMPTYYRWQEDSSYTIDLGTNFSDIDHDDIDWYINYTTSIWGRGYVHPDNIDILIDNETGIVTLIPHANITGIMYINFTAVDNNHTITNHTGTRTHVQDWYLRNDYGHTTTELFLLNITQLNDPPWASDVYISPASPSYTSTLSCEYTFNDIEAHAENTSATLYKWYHNDEGISAWQELAGQTSKTLDNAFFDLDDWIICSVIVKDDYQGYADLGEGDESLWALSYANSTAVVIGIESDTPSQEEQIIIGVG